MGGQTTINRMYNAQIGSDRPRYITYPNMDGATGASIQLTSGAALTMGAWAQVEIAATFTTEYWICALLLQATSLAEEHEVALGFGTAPAGTQVASWGVNTAAFAEGHQLSCMYPLRIAALAGVVGRCASITGGGTANVKVLVATGL